MANKLAYHALTFTVLEFRLEATGSVYLGVVMPLAPSKNGKG